MQTSLKTLVALLLALAAVTHGALVTATGKAAAGPTAREQALAEALREAVNQGGGVDLASSTKSRDSALEFDRILACSFGHVRSYRVLKQGLDAAGRYAVEVEADVVKAAPAVADRLGMQMLIRLKGSPRVLIEADERLDGMPVDQPAAAAVLTQAAVDLGMQVTDVGRSATNAARRGTRAALLGDAQDAALRQAGVTTEADFILRAEVSADVGKPHAIYGVMLRSVAMSVNLSARWADTGKVVAQRTLPSTTLTSSAPTPAAALQDTLKAMLCLPGSDGAPTPSDDLLRAVVTRWLVELDLGTLVRAEIQQVSKAAFDRLRTGLGETTGIGEVWARGFDARHLSVIEFESRLDAAQVADIMVGLLGGSHAADVASSHYILLVPGTGNGHGTPAGTDAAPAGRDSERAAIAPPRAATTTPERGRAPPWAAIGALVLVALASGAGFLVYLHRTRA
jgi:hypothetical protein